MKKLTIVGATIFTIALLIPQISQGQGTLYLSSLSSTSTGSASVGSDSWLASLIGTGNNPGGYTLNSIQLAMTDASGNPSGFTVMIYGEAPDVGTVIPGSSLGTLTGSVNPSTAGVYSFTAPPDFILTAHTAYFIVITSSTPVANGAYNWNESAYPPGVNSWGIFNLLDQSSNGTSGWSSTSNPGIPQLAIYATPAPEPGVIGLFALGGLLLGFRRWKAKPI